ncbi:AAA family ATPase [Cohnella sp. GCM10027633]|uniref:AAA family ATPase n=1 Tax=unclassified Cohnella TaxID=2636738 RepID=UPI003642CE57
MIFNNLSIQNWNQFRDVEISLHPKITIITGANGAGKSTILRLFSRLVGWGFNELSTPIKGKMNKGFKYRISRRLKLEEDVDAHQQISIGNITLKNGQILNINAPLNTDQAIYGISINPHPSLKGINIPSHRTAYTYRQITSIPVKAHTRNEAYNMFNSSVMQRTLGQYSDPPIYQMKASLISLAVFGKGNEYATSDSEALELFLGFIEILKKLLPPTLGFETLNIRSGEVVLVTKSGEFLLDSVSGGIGAILDLAWQIYMFEAGKDEPFFVIIDEAENHLHASMQRQLLPSLIDSFPNAQFIVSTHSPLMVNSVKESFVYVLKYNDERTVDSYLLDFENKAGNAAQILRDVLGVPITMPIWVEEDLNNILDKYRGNELTPESYLSLKNDLSALGLADHLPQALGFLQGGNR